MGGGGKYISTYYFDSSTRSACLRITITPPVVHSSRGTGKAKYYMLMYGPNAAATAVTAVGVGVG